MPAAPAQTPQPQQPRHELIKVVAAAIEPDMIKEIDKRLAILQGKLEKKIEPLEAMAAKARAASEEASKTAKEHLDLYTTEIGIRETINDKVTAIETQMAPLAADVGKILKGATPDVWSQALMQKRTTEAEVKSEGAQAPRGEDDEDGAPPGWLPPDPRMCPKHVKELPDIFTGEAGSRSVKYFQDDVEI